MPVVSMIYNRHGFYSPGAHVIYGRQFKPSVISVWAWVRRRRQGGRQEALMYSRGWRKALQAGMAPCDEAANAKLHKSSADDRDDLSWCPSVDGYQRKGLKTSLFRMKGGNLWLFFSPLVLFINVSGMGNVSREEASFGQGQSGECDQALPVSALTLRGRKQRRKPVPLTTCPTCFWSMNIKRSLHAEK